ncbi:MAG: hypothetical protein OEZ34_12670 [Spirochaetia bacterium]|nr:hypothetical protein [Spirochaetia bacterium]
MNKTTNFLVTAAVAGILSAGASDVLNAKPAKGAKGECHGINSCKGKGECGGKGYSCAGNNSCKGKGWISMTETECKEKGGEFKPSSMDM